MRARPRPPPGPSAAVNESFSSAVPSSSGLLTLRAHTLKCRSLCLSARSEEHARPGRMWMYDELGFHRRRVAAGWRERYIVEYNSDPASKSIHLTDDLDSILADFYQNSFPAKQTRQGIFALSSSRPCCCRHLHSAAENRGADKAPELFPFWGLALTWIMIVGRCSVVTHCLPRGTHWAALATLFCAQLTRYEV